MVGFLLSFCLTWYMLKHIGLIIWRVKRGRINRVDCQKLKGPICFPGGESPQRILFSRFAGGPESRLEGPSRA